MIDQDASFDHWTMAGIAPDVTSLAEDTPPEGAVAALNGSGDSGLHRPVSAGRFHTRLSHHRALSRPSVCRPP